MRPTFDNYIFHIWYCRSPSFPWARAARSCTVGRCPIIYAGAWWRMSEQLRHNQGSSRQQTLRFQT